MGGHDTATIRTDTAGITLVNVYEVEPQRQSELARLLSEMTQALIAREPGFISVSIHSSLDGARVVNYAQWASKAHFEAFMKKPQTRETLKRFAALAKSVAPGLYRVDAVHGPADT